MEQQVDVRGLPDQVVSALQVMVDSLRQQFVQAEAPKQPVQLPLWDGTVTGRLTRDEIYDDAG